MTRKIYTRTGDKGTTHLFGVREKVSKAHPRVEAYGNIDELNSFIGLMRAELSALKETEHIDRQLEWIQHVLFGIGAHIASPTGSPHCLW